MSVIYSYQDGKLKTGELEISTSTGMIVISSSRALKDFTNETINIWVSRSSSDDTYLATRVPLKDFINACLTNNEIGVLPYKSMNTYMCEIGVEGALRIEDGEKLKISIENMKSADFYEIRFIEDFETTGSHLLFEHKSLTPGTTDVKLDVTDAVMAIFTADGDLEVGMTFDGKEKRFSFIDLQLLQLEVRPSYGTSLADNSNLLIDESYVTVPTSDITQLRFYKDTASTVKVTLLKYGVFPTSKNASALTQLLSKSKPLPYR